MEIKDSLLTPKTTFAMRGNLKELEPMIREQWQNIDLYQQLIQKNKDNKPYILHDGPPYANGEIHVGHAFNQILKDFVVRTKAMAGFYTPYIPGWDCHGLPIENALQKKGIKRNSMPAADFRDLCQKFAEEQIALQRNQFKALGAIGDWDHPYVTYAKEFEANQIGVFAEMALKGLIYKGLKPVYWSPVSETALAEAEIVYKDKEDTSIYVTFKVVDGKDLLPADTNFVIWTTTPWTMPANLAIALNPNMTYGLYETNKGLLIFAVTLEKELTTTLALTKVKLVKTFLGQELEGITTKHPMYDRLSSIVLADYVTEDAGTGCVHTAPGHGADDFITGQKYHLDVLCPVDSKGYMTEEAGSSFVGLHYTEANEKVVSELSRLGVLLASIKFTHSYPHDWRTETPLIFRATDQWFASIEPIKAQLLKAIDEVKWYTEWANIRMSNMMKDRSDWCISRQRLWGLPIPIIYNEDGSPILEREVFDHIIAVFKAGGSNEWFNRPVQDLLPSGYTNPRSPHGDFKKETDIMDVWFDSGSSFATVMREWLKYYPADLYLEGSDQYRGWFNSSLIIGVSTTDQAPYKEVLSHGFVLDGNGFKMSKSKGNVLDPNKVVATNGADILRLWAASTDYSEDVTISDEILKQATENYRKIRNTFRFLSGNLANGDVNKQFNPLVDMQSTYEYVDQLILNRLYQVNQEVKDLYAEFKFNAALSKLNNFINNDLSAFYLDITKDILYCERPDSQRRLQVQSVYYQITNSLLRLFAPILVHTTEEFYQNAFKLSVSSVHLLNFEELPAVDQSLLGEYEVLMNLKSDVSKAIEAARNQEIIKSSQAAMLEINIKDPVMLAVFNKLTSIEQTRVFIVSFVKLTSEPLDDYKYVAVRVTKAPGIKCERCWNIYSDEVIVDNMCPRCQDAYHHAKKELV